MARKNVIWILADQLRADLIGCNGDPNVFTPNIDNLSAQGVNFEKAVSGSPLCCPCRGSLLTGLYPHKSSVMGHEHRLDVGKITIADLFNEAGYETVYIGKWHLDGIHESEGRAAKQIVPLARRGRFKTWLGYDNNNSQFDSYIHGHNNGQEVPLQRLKGYETDCLTDLLIDKIATFSKQSNNENNKDENKDPFFMILSVQPPHNPYIAPAEFMGKYNGQQLTMRANVPNYPHVDIPARRDLAGAYAMIENLDWNIGRIVHSLSEANLDLDTHLIVFSDHGDMHGSHGYFRKTNPYEESIRVPFIISGAQPMSYDGMKCGRTDALINHVDVTATTLGLCGLPKPDWLDGFDYSYYRTGLKQPNNEPQSAYLQMVEPTMHPESVDKAWRGLVTKDGWKYVMFKENDWLLFNLNNDPYELINLVHDVRWHDKKNQLKLALQHWIETTDDPF